MIEYQVYFETALSDSQTIRLVATAWSAGITQVARFTTALQILIVNNVLPKVEFGVVNLTLG